MGYHHSHKENGSGKRKGPTGSHLGKGPFYYKEIAYSKAPSGSYSGMTKNQGCVSGKHGQHGGSKNNNMDHNTGGHRIGSKDATFKHSNYYQAGPTKPYPKHDRQPGGNKKLAGPN